MVQVRPLRVRNRDRSGPDHLLDLLLDQVSAEETAADVHPEREAQHLVLRYH